MQGKYVTAIAIALVLLGHEGRAQSSDEEAAAQSSIQITSDSDNCTAMISDADECQRTLYIWIAEASDVKGSAALEAVFENSDFAGQLSNSNAVSFNTNDCTDDDKRKVNVSSTYSDTSVSDAVDILRKFYEENDCFEEAAGALSSGIAGALVLFLVAAFIMM